MGILGIPNRTEDWKTVRHFHGLDGNAKVRLVTKLGGLDGIEAKDIRIELFWYGMRDYIDKQNKNNKDLTAPEEFISRYDRLFPHLRKQIQEAKDLRLTLRCSNYHPQHPDNDTGGLHNNLRNTEIDIVLDTPTHLFIGEAKHESKLRGDGKLVLVHQLIRQYVMASILVELTCPKKKIVPFVVGDKRKSLMNVHQVRFMIGQHNRGHSPGDWLKEANVLSWDCIRKITNPESTHNCTRPKCNGE